MDKEEIKRLKELFGYILDTIDGKPCLIKDCGKWYKVSEFDNEEQRLQWIKNLQY